MAIDTYVRESMENKHFPFKKPESKEERREIARIIRKSRKLIPYHRAIENEGNYIPK